MEQYQSDAVLDEGRLCAFWIIHLSALSKSGYLQDSIMPRNKDRKEQVKNQWKKQDDYYGMGAEQIKIHHGDSLHLAGFKGKGIQIAVIDAGFYNVDAMKIFKNTTILWHT